ncbi:D-alanine--D-serine ligase VanG [Paenibacillus spongiae]|uniref:D-alanine--D-alanine ligase n=1 Tax=Paenibacillus spongiae TaxID=2909671 RepID=A0ABY5S9S1_9BACL|nr:D-alanine--D-serine ligase VanG [Paenibacillus spongiae]UVI30669.1 D-alanine--D-serine ligase VanG [Paenibacillus spongiae]
MELKNIAVLFGGCSTEYDVSLQSAASVIDHLDRSKYHFILLGITREGTWLRYNGSTADIRSDTWHTYDNCIPAFISPCKNARGIVELSGTEYRTTPVDVAFPVLHGKNGEDGTVQGLLELSGIPFVGCDTLSSAICMDKATAGQLVRAAGVETAASVTAFAGDDLDPAIREAEKLGFPLYVKPSRSGSSFGITKAYDKQALRNGIQAAFSHDRKVVIEQNVTGFEVGCAVLGYSEPVIAAIDEIELTGEFFDYEEKYSLRTSNIHLPARIEPGTADRIKAAARLIYKTLGCRGLARVDMFLTEEGRIVFNEVNTMPGFTAASRYPNMMRYSGISYPQLMDRLISLAAAKEEANHETRC